MEMIARPRPIFMLNGETLREGVHYLVDKLGAPNWLPDVTSKLKFGDVAITVNPPVPDGKFPEPDYQMDYRVLLPESAADAIAEACAEEFDTGSKPDSAEDEPYAIGIEGECAQEAIASLPEAESAALFNYPYWVDDALWDIPFGGYLDDYYHEWLEVQIEYRSEAD